MFNGRHFDRSVILLCVRWYLAYNLSLRDLEEMMAERGIHVDHSTVHRWVVHFAPLLLESFNGENVRSPASGTLMKLMSGCAVAGCIFTAPSTAWATRSSSCSAKTGIYWLPSALSERRSRAMADRSASSSTAAKRTGKQSLPAMARAGFEINRNGY